MKKIIPSLILLSTVLLSTPIYSFKSVGVSHLDWTKETEDKTANRDFNSIKLDGGFGYDWMDFYGYLTMENPNKSYDAASPYNQRYVGFFDWDIEIKNNYKIHIQNFYANSKTYTVNDFVVGLGYKYQHNNGFWIKPFLGVHITNDTFYDGYNGYMGGWVLNYPFVINDSKFSLFQWNEIEFGRQKSFYEDNGTPIGDGKSYGLNGAISLWYYYNNDFSGGFEYRYANHKLGSIEYQSAYVYTLKYNF